MYKPELIEEAKKLLTKKELVNITELDSVGIGFSYNYETRNKITDKTCWFYPSIKNFNIILSLIKPGSKVLDIGCGSAIVGKYILDKIPNVKYKGIRKSMYKVDLFKYMPDGYIEEISSTKDTIEVIKQYNYDTWLLFYPPYGTPMGYEVLEEFLENNSVKTLLFLGEIDGCVGDNRFKKLLGELIYDTPDNLDIEFYDIDCYSFIRDELIKITKNTNTCNSKNSLCSIVNRISNTTLYNDVENLILNLNDNTIENIKKMYEDHKNKIDRRIRTTPVDDVIEQFKKNAGKISEETNKKVLLIENIYNKCRYLSLICQQTKI